MRYFKIIVVVSFLILCLVSCKSAYSDIDVGVTVYEIEDDELIVTSMKEIDEVYSAQAVEEKITRTLKEQHEEHVKLDKVMEYGDKISITLTYDSIMDYQRIYAMKHNEDKKLEHDTLEDYLDNQDISYDEFEDRDLLYNVRDNTEISEGQLEKYEDERIIMIDCGPSEVIVDGDILFASKEGKLSSKDKIFFDKLGTYYILYKPSSGISKWILWALLLSIVLYASFLGIKRRSKKVEHTCKICKQKNDDDAIYCKKCGKLLEEQD